MYCFAARQGNGADAQRRRYTDYKATEFMYWQFPNLDFDRCPQLVPVHAHQSRTLRRIARQRVHLSRRRCGTRYQTPLRLVSCRFNGRPTNALHKPPHAPDRVARRIVLPQMNRKNNLLINLFFQRNTGSPEDKHRPAGYGWRDATRACPAGPVLPALCEGQSIILKSGWHRYRRIVEKIDEISVIAEIRVKANGITLHRLYGINGSAVGVTSNPFRPNRVSLALKRPQTV